MGLSSPSDHSGLSNDEDQSSEGGSGGVSPQAPPQQPSTKYYPAALGSAAPIQIQLYAAAGHEPEKHISITLYMLLVLLYP